MNFRYHLWKFVVEREIFLGIGIFGLFSMLADLLNDIGENNYAKFVRGFGLFILVVLYVCSYMLNNFKELISVPIMFTEEKDKKTSRNMYDSFVSSQKKLKNAPKLLEKMLKIKSEDLIIRLDNNPRNCTDPADWISAWCELVREWEDNIDEELTDHPLSNEGYCYHIYPHIVLPLSFALGATVNLRRSLILYHKQSPDGFCKVIDLTEPREAIYEPESKTTDDTIMPPEIEPENFNDLMGGKKLILHIIISARHPVNFQLHDDYKTASNAAIVYDCDFSPNEDWLPYIQKIITTARPVIKLYEKVDICLICPSAIAFALGMAFSRDGSIEVCHHCPDGKYRPVFPLAEIERRLTFS